MLVSYIFGIMLHCNGTGTVLMSYQSIFCYAWDLAEKGVPSAAESFRKRNLNAITLATSYHAGKFLRPHGKSGKVYFPEDGTAYFKTNTGVYGAIQPVENSLVGTQDILRECCDLEEMDVTAWIVLMHNSRLGELHLEDCVSNAFGDRYIYSLCPCSPRTREYAVALCRDVTDNYQVAGISLESPGFLPYEHGYHHEFALVKPNQWLNNLLGLCFCDHCMTQSIAAGIDTAGLKERVADAISACLASDFDYPEDMAGAFWAADLVLDPELSAFMRWRCNPVTSLVAEIRNAVRPDAAVAVIPSVARPTGGAWYEGSDLKSISEVADYLEVCFYEPSVERIKSDLADVARRIGGTEKIRGILRPAHPDLNSRESVMGAVRALREGGVPEISFYNFGHLRQSSLDWMADALAAGDGAA